MPIGNIKDITVRMLEAIETSDYILCESIETFKNQMLEGGWKISGELIEYCHTRINDLHIKKYVTEDELSKLFDFVVEELKNNKKILVVSEYGSVFIEDPGADLIEKVLNAGLEITVLPGPSIVTTAYVAATIDSPDNIKDNNVRGSFLFQPFFMIENEDKEKMLESLKNDFRTKIFLDKTQNIKFLLSLIDKVFGDRLIVAAFNLTTENEKIYRGRTKDIINILNSYESLHGQLITIVCKGVRF